MWAARRCANHDVVPHVVAQVIAAICAAATLWFIASGHAGWTPGSFASNGYRDLSPGKYALASSFVRSRDDVFVLFIIIGTASMVQRVGSPVFRSAER